jgi:hypothetical protein
MGLPSSGGAPGSKKYPAGIAAASASARAPGRVLGQPSPDRVIDRQPALGFQLEQDHRRECLGVAADLP